MKRLISRAFRAAGFQLSRIGDQATPPHPLVHHQIGLVFDVGANTGQYGRYIRSQGYKGKIVSFEPLSEAHHILETNTVDDANWIVYPRCALGATCGQTNMNVSKNSFSSSLLPMLAAHSDAAPESVYCNKENVRVVPLDAIFADFRLYNERTFLKIDTQGYEKEVLEGAKETLPRITGVQLELSIVPLYEGQALYDYFFEFFARNGFQLWSIVPEFSNPRTGRLLQFDGIFVRP